MARDVRDGAPERFPMSLREFAATTKLDPLVEAGLGVYASAEERLLEAWQALVDEFLRRPVTG